MTYLYDLLAMMMTKAESKKKKAEYLLFFDSFLLVESPSIVAFKKIFLKTLFMDLRTWALLHCM